MNVHVTDLLGAWALDVCEDADAATVEAHLERCPECARQARQLRSAAGWLGIEQVMSPPPQLRKSMLDKARRRRPPVLLRTLTEAYAGQVSLLDRTLGGLAPEDWRVADARHGDLAGLISHLTTNDAMLAADLALPTVASSPATLSVKTGDSGRSVHAAWHDQATIVLNGLDDEADLDRVVSLAGRGARRPGALRDALVQRAFETWTHLDDIHEGFGQTLSVPRPEQVRRIVALAVALLPAALAFHGFAVPGQSRLALTGSASGEWTVPIGDVTIRADAVDFARLVANRRSPDNLEYTVDGDPVHAKRLLEIAATLGCD